MKTKALFATLGFTLGTGLIPLAAAPVADARLNRTVLPIPEPIKKPITILDARNAKAPPRFQVTAPAGVPNVLVILIDDQGFGVSSAFGGPVKEPVLDRLASEGLRYNNFNTTALCSPTRTALLTGYNHHSNNMGGIAEIATSFPGNTGVRPQTITPMAEVLHCAKMVTAQQPLVNTMKPHRGKYRYLAVMIVGLRIRALINSTALLVAKLISGPQQFMMG